jgi:hypothetical protein
VVTEVEVHGPEKLQTLRLLSLLLHIDHHYQTLYGCRWYGATSLLTALSSIAHSASSSEMQALVRFLTCLPPSRKSQSLSLDLALATDKERRQVRLRSRSTAAAHLVSLNTLLLMSSVSRLESLAKTLQVWRRAGFHLPTDTGLLNIDYPPVRIRCNVPTGIITRSRRSLRLPLTRPSRNSIGTLTTMQSE